MSEPPLHARGNFLDSSVELDRRLLDYIVGLDTEINELVDGSDLYTPSVSLGDVALPPEHRQALRFWGQNSWLIDVIEVTAVKFQYCFGQLALATLHTV